MAVCLEVRGRVQASVVELAAIPGPVTLEAEQTRERLVLAALLKDRPEIAAFQTVTIQEGLAAEAFLATDDVVATLREVAVASLAGREVFRADLDHVLDLVLEGASAEDRARLRRIDELRWARTQSTSIDKAEAIETLRLLWVHFTGRRTWVDRRSERQIRGARAAVRRLAAAFPEAAQGLRAEVVGATTSAEPTDRANALAFLQEFPPHDGNVELMRPLLRDENRVVRRACAEAAEELELAELVPDLEAAYRVDTDELALETLGLALLALTPSEERLRAAHLLADQPLGWDRLGFYVIRALPLAELLEFFRERGIDPRHDERLLSEELEKRPAAEWREEHVAMLVEIVTRARGSHGPTFIELELLNDVCARNPQAALEGARRGAGEGTTWWDLLFLRSLEWDHLEEAATGVLQKPLVELLEFLDREKQRETQPAPTPPLPARQERRLSQWLSEGWLSETHCPSSSGVMQELLSQVPELQPEERARLRQLAEAWWPEEPLAGLVQVEGSTTSMSVRLTCALATSAALDLPLDPERWLEILGSRALRGWWDAAEWLAHHFPVECSQSIATLISEITDDHELTLALRTLPRLDAALGGALARATVVIDSPHSGHVLVSFARKVFSTRSKMSSRTHGQM